jgi:type IV pilus assembly protein PilE
MSTRTRPLRAGGFTLIELMATILIASILLSIAVPTYMSQVRKSRRTEARTAVLDLATREERYFSVNNNYSALDSDLGYGNTNAAITNLPVGTGYYTVTVTTPPTATGQAGFRIVAAAAGVQTKDTQCLTFTVDQSGAQTSAPTTTCWN